MPDQHYLMTEEQIQELKERDLPYCPSVFNYYQGQFKRYCAYMRLHDLKPYGWADSEQLEEFFQKFYADPVVQRLSLIRYVNGEVVDLYEEAMKNDQSRRY